MPQRPRWHNSTTRGELASIGVAMAVPALKGQLVLNPDYVLFLGTGLHARAHRHLTASITLSLDAPFEVGIGRELRQARAMLVRPDTENTVDARNARIINVQIDPETDLYAR